MKKSLFFTVSILSGLLLTVVWIATISAQAEAPQSTAFPPAAVFPMEGGDPPLVALEIDQAILVSAATPGSARISAAESFTVANQLRTYITDAESPLFGLPSPDEIVTITYVITPYDSDGENIDAMMYYAPDGWEILAISDAPAVNTGTGTVTQAFGVTGTRGIAYWGRESLLPDFLTFSGDLLQSNDGVWAIDGSTAYTFSIKIRVDADAATCPGDENRVGIPWDPDDFTYLPVYAESMPAWLYGDGGGGTITRIKLMSRLPCAEPEIRLEKKVGESGDCAAEESVEEIEIPQGDQVEYCFQWFNDSFFVTVTLHQLDDTFFSNYYVNLPYTLPARSRTYFPIPYTITGTVGLTITNQATWTATTPSGYGQSVQADPESAFTTTVYSATDTDQAVVTIGPKSNKPTGLYLPLMFGGYPPEYPKLTYPPEGAELTTLIPTLEFNLGPTPPYSGVRVYLGSVWNEFNVLLNDAGGATSYNFTSNLNPGTTYYWKVCYIQSELGDDLGCSVVGTFTSGSGGTLPDQPVLKAPNDGALDISPDNIFVQWNLAANTNFYEAWLTPDGATYYVVTTSGPSVNYSQFFSLPENTTYNWYVRGKNSYGWGPKSATWSFTTSASTLTFPPE